MKHSGFGAWLTLRALNPPALIAMNENPNQATAQDVLQSSELTARLLRRLTVSLGIIDVVTLRQARSRLATWIIRSSALLDDLRTRYGIADDSVIKSPPLVMEQPWMVNINSYLTNYNAFSSTTNQFISSSAVTPQSLQSAAPPSSQASQSSAPLTIYSSGHAPIAAASSTRLPADSSSSDSSSSPEKFRIRRNPSRRAWKANPADAQDAAQPLVLKEASASTSVALPATQSEAGKVRPADDATASNDRTAIASDGRTQPNLPLARTPIAQSQTQSERRDDEGLRVSFPVAKLREVERKRADVEDERPILHARVSSKPGAANPTEELKKVSGSAQPAPRRADVLPLATKADVVTPAAKAANSTPAVKAAVVTPISKASTPPPTSLTALPLIQKQPASPSREQNRQPDFIWRKSADIPTMRELTSLISRGNTQSAVNRTTGGASSVQSPQSGQTVTPDGESRRDELRAGSELTTERILRNINRKLLIERERRGY